MLKFEVLREQGITISESVVLDIVLNPESLHLGYNERMIAQASLDEEKVLRVVYEEHINEIVIVTFYPGRRSRYE